MGRLSSGWSGGVGEEEKAVSVEIAVTYGCTLLLLRSVEMYSLLAIIPRRYTIIQ